MRSNPVKRLALALALAWVTLFLTWFGVQTLSQQAHAAPVVAIPVKDSAVRLPYQAAVVNPVDIVIDDFEPQPYQDDSVYYYNRLDGDRGVLNDSLLNLGPGQITVTVAAGRSWGGMWLGLNHPLREGLPLNFSALLPAQILPQYQSQATGLTVQLARATAGRIFKIELKNGSNIRWTNQVVLSGGGQTLSYSLPPTIESITELVLVLDQAGAGDYVVIDRVSLTATTQITDVAQAAFVWSYGMLLDNWDPATGLVRDKAKDASGEFDAVQATGSLAAATALADQLGVINRISALQIVNKISDTLLTDVPRYYGDHGLWPHWVISDTGALTISHNTEWSSVDTVIAAIGLLDAQSALGLNTAGTVQMLQTIDWNNLLIPGVGISHGYSYTGTLIPFAWDTFGGESWLVALAYAAATGQVSLVKYPTPPTANGSGFIDELAWLFVLPPSVVDYWGVDWDAYRQAATYSQTLYYPAVYTAPTCFPPLDLFGLSAAEVPDPSKVSKDQIYQAFGIGGRFSPPNNGETVGGPVVTPHYSAMIALLRPTEAISMWTWLINPGPFSPLNNVESLAFSGPPGCSASDMTWNQLRGSWNLALQTLGWGRYLAQRQGKVPVLWQATVVNEFLRKGYLLLVPDGLSSTYLPTILKST